MKAAVLIKNADPKDAFVIQELPNISITKPDEVRIAIKAFGLNFADVMAMRGQYQGCPPLPTIIGYEGVGIVDQVGSEVTHLKIGDRVVAFSRFGCYATQVVAKGLGVSVIPNTMSNAEAAALATQYCTAYYAACQTLILRKGELVLVHSAAGGVGIALVQLAKLYGCTVFGTVGSDSKAEFVKKIGVDYAINYETHDFETEILRITGNKKIDVIFDAIGGKSVKKGIKLLNSAGRMVCYGAASMAQRKKNIFKTIKSGLGFGFYHPAQLMMPSKSLIGVNMLEISDNRPDILQHCLQSVVKLVEEKKIMPHTGANYPITQLAEAITALENRKSIGKIVVEW